MIYLGFYLLIGLLAGLFYFWDMARYEIGRFYKCQPDRAKAELYHTLGVFLLWPIPLAVILVAALFYGLERLEGHLIKKIGKGSGC